MTHHNSKITHYYNNKNQMQPSSTPKTINLITHHGRHETD